MAFKYWTTWRRNRRASRCQQHRCIQENEDEDPCPHTGLGGVVVAHQASDQRLLLLGQHIIPRKPRHFLVGVGAELDARARAALPAPLST
jgi:hypothetical protein